MPITIRALLPTIITDPNMPEWPSITVHPQDLVLADEDGVIVVPAAMLEDVLEAAEEGQEVDEKCRVDIMAGKGVKETFAKHRGATKKH